MAQLLVRNLEDGVVVALKKRAAAEGKSLEQCLRDILRDAALPDVARRLAIADRIRAMTPAGPQSDSTKLIRRDRNR